MPIDLFGFTIGKKGKESPKPTSNDIEKTKSVKSFVAPDDYDGSLAVEAGGIFGTFIDFNGKIKNENDLINRYRSMSLFPEVDMAITDIINDAIVIDEDKEPVDLVLDKVNLSNNIKKKIEDEFDVILKLLNFQLLEKQV